MLSNKYQALIGTKVFMPALNSVIDGTVIDVHKTECGKENFIEVNWNMQECNLPVIFSIKNDIGVKIFFNEQQARLNSIKRKL